MVGGEGGITLVFCIYQIPETQTCLNAFIALVMKPGGVKKWMPSKLLKQLQYTENEKEGEQVIQDLSVFDISVQLVIISGNMF